jgi:hypothetical protein
MGKELVRGKMMKRPFNPIVLVTSLLLGGVLLSSCAQKETAETPAPPQTPPDAIQTLMLTYETELGPETSARFQVASDGTFVRLGNETEKWRLFDTKNRTITFVDQTAGTATEVTFDEALGELNRKLAEIPAEGAPTATVVEGPGEPERGHPTHRIRVDVGSFSREITLSKDLLLPGEFFAMKVITDPLDPRYAPILKDVVPVLVRQNGTLLSETSRLEVEGGEPVTATTKLVSVTTVQLSRKAFELPDGITVTKKGDVSPETPATESR